MRLFNRREPEMVETATALPGRSEEMRVPTLHEVLGTPPIGGPFPRRGTNGGLRDGLLLGGRAAVLAGRRRVHDGGGL